MTLRLIVTVVEIVLLVAILGWFLARIARLLVAISATCGKIAFGVRAVESQVSVIGPTTERLNSNLAQVADRLNRAAEQAERLGSRR